jgi:hypothetical protein
VIPLGIEPATLRLVAHCLNQLRQRVPPPPPKHLTLKIDEHLDLNAFGCLSGTATMNEKLFCQATSVPRCW